MAHQAGKPPSALDHVVDTNHWEFFDRLFGDPVGLHLGSFNLLGYQFKLTKYMVLELIAAGLILIIYLPLCRRASTGELPKGKWWNCFESLLTYIRNEVARPNIGDKEADAFVPYLWTVFLFILFSNLLGMIPWMGSPTASISVTGALAALTLVIMHGAPIIKYGFVPYMKSMWLDTGLGALGIPIAAMIFVIELMGSLIKCFVLSVRLFANMFAGHMVLAMILLFIVVVGQQGFSLLWPVVTISSIAGVVALSLLELFVAFLQAYIFTFLTALFTGMALHHAAEHGGHGHGEHAGHGHHAEPALAHAGH